MGSIAKHSLAGLLAVLTLALCPLAAYATPNTTIIVGPDEANKDLAAAFEAIPENAGNVVIEIAGNVHQKSTFLVSIPADKDISSLTLAARDESGATIGAEYDVDNYLFANGVPLTIGKGITLHANLCGGSNESDLQANTYLDVKEGAAVKGSIYGGCFNGNLTGNTSITVEGDVLWSVVGGGFARSSASSPNVQANVEGSTSITIEASGSAGSLYGGGKAGYLSTPKTEATATANVTGSASTIIKGRFNSAYGGGSAGFTSAGSSSDALTKAVANVEGDASVELGPQAQSNTLGSSMELYGGGIATGSATSACNFATANVMGTASIKALEDDLAATTQLRERVFSRLYGGGCALSKGAAANTGGSRIEAARCCQEATSGTIGGGYANDGATANVEGLSHVEIFGIEGQSPTYENANFVAGGGFTDNATANTASSARVERTEVIVHQGANLASGSSTSLSLAGGGSVQGNDGNADVIESTSVTIEAGARIAQGVAGGGVVWSSRARNSSADVGDAHVIVEDGCTLSGPLIGGGYVYKAQNSSANAKSTSTSIGSGSTLGNYVIGGGYAYYQAQDCSASVEEDAVLSVADNVTINGNFTIGGGFTSYQVSNCTVAVGGKASSVFGNNVTSKSFVGGGMTYYNSTNCSADVVGLVSSQFGENFSNDVGEFIGGGYAYYDTSSCSSDSGAVETTFAGNAKLKAVSGGGWASWGDSDSADVHGSVTLSLGKNTNVSSLLVGGGRVESSPHSHADTGIDTPTAPAVSTSAEEGLSTPTLYGGGYVASSESARANVAGGIETKLSTKSLNVFYGAGCVSAGTNDSQADVVGAISTELDGSGLGTFNGGGGVINYSTKSHANVDGTISNTLAGFSFAPADEDYLAKIVGNGAVLASSESHANTTGDVTTHITDCTINGNGTSSNMPYLGGRSDSDVAGNVKLILENTKLVNQPLFAEKGWQGAQGDLTIQIIGTAAYDAVVDATRTNGDATIVFGNDQGQMTDATVPRIINDNEQSIVDIAIKPGASLSLACESEQALEGTHNVDVAEGAKLVVTQSTAPASLGGNLTSSGTVSLPTGGSIAGSGTLDGALTLEVTGTPAVGQTYFDFSDQSTGSVSYTDPDKKLVLEKDDTTADHTRWTMRELTYPVTFSLNDGTETVFATQTIAHNQKVALPDPAPEREGYVFNGWFKDAEGAQAWDFDTDTVTDNLTLYAKWNKSITVYVKVGDGEGDAHGTVAPATPQIFTGEPLQYTVTPDYGYRIGTVTVDSTPLPVVMQADLRTGVVSYEPESPSTIVVTFVPLDNQTADDIVENLPAVKPDDTPEEVAKKTDTVLDAKLDYESMPEDEKETVKQETIDKLNDAVASLPNVDVKVDPQISTEIDSNIDIPDEYKSRFIGAVSKDDIEKLKTGAVGALKVVMEIKDIDAPTDANEQTAFESELGTYELGQHFLASVTKQLYKSKEDTTPQASTSITTLPAPVKLTFDVPATLINKVDGTTRSFAMVRTHYDGRWQAAFLADEDKDATNEKVEVSTDRFSTYSIVYKDVHHVTFDSNGGSKIDPQDIENKGNIAKPTDPTREGFTFDGWYEDPDSSTAWDFPTGKVTAPITLHAKWTKNAPPAPTEHTVTFVANGGVPEPSAQTIIEGDKATEPTAGWWKDAEFTSSWDFATDTISGPTTLYAKWIESVTPPTDTFAVVFDARGGSPAPEAQTVDDGSTVEEPTVNPEKAGYVFDGWFSDEACTKAWDFSTPVTADLTLYAKWTARTYAVTFDADGGQPEPGEQTVAYGQLVQPVQAPEKEGFEFVAWYADDADLTVSWDFAHDVVEGPVTLYAKWNKVPDEPKPPVDPVDPDQPDNPTPPVDPDEPDQPDNPTTPDNPKPTEPAKPTVPQNNGKQPGSGTHADKPQADHASGKTLAPTGDALPFDMLAALAILGLGIAAATCVRAKRTNR